MYFIGICLIFCMDFQFYLWKIKKYYGNYCPALNMFRNIHYPLFLSIIILLTGFLYSPSIRYPFIWDDKAVIEKNHYLRSQESVGLFFQPSFWNKKLPISRFDYRPLQMIVLAGISRLSGREPLYFRVVNILLHLVIIWLLYKLTLGIGCVKKTALFASAVFAFHPVHIEAVVNARNISELLSSAWLIISFLLFCHKRNKGIYLFFSWLAFLAAVLTKESALIYPAILTATVLIISSKFADGIILRRTIPFWLISIVGLTAKFFLLAGSPLGDKTSCENFFIISIRLIGTYLSLLLFPARLKVLYSFNKPVDWAMPENFLPVLIGVGAIIIICRVYKNNRIFFWSCICLILSLFPSIIKIGQIGRIVAEQRLYFPSLFFCIALAVILNNTINEEKKSWRKLVGIIIGLSRIIILITFAGLLRDYITSWSSDLSLWTRATRFSPHSALAYNNLAKVYHSLGDEERAINELRNALRCNPRHKESHSNLGVIHGLAGRKDQAIAEFKKSLQEDPFYGPASLHLAEIYLQQKRWNEAEDLLRSLLKHNYYLPKAHNALAITLEEKGNYRDAEIHYQTAADLNHEFAVPLRNLAALYFDRKDYTRALEAGRKALKRNIGHPKGYLLLARGYIATGNFSEARRLLRKGLEYNPENWKVKSMLMSLESERINSKAGTEDIKNTLK